VRIFSSASEIIARDAGSQRSGLNGLRARKGKEDRAEDKRDHEHRRNKGSIEGKRPRELGCRPSKQDLLLIFCEAYKETKERFGFCPPR